MTYIDDELARLLRLREEPDDLEARSTDAMRFIPVDLRLAYPTIHQPNSCDLFNISDLTEQFEVHAGVPALEDEIGATAKMSVKLDVAGAGSGYLPRRMVCSFWCPS